MRCSCLGAFCVSALALGCGEVSALRDAGQGPDDAGVPVDAPPQTDLTIWPNVQSAASSDPWIAAHHDQIRLMQPRVLALNFDNGNSNAQMNALLAQIFAGLKEGSRYHGYVDPAAPAFLDYQLARSVDLTDHPPPSGWQFRNSTRSPRKPAGTPDYWHFHYGALFSQQFADTTDLPIRPSRHAISPCAAAPARHRPRVWIYGDDTPGDVNAAGSSSSSSATTPGSPGRRRLDPCAGSLLRRRRHPRVRRFVRTGSTRPARAV
jgi:hypothetical protein